MPTKVFVPRLGEGVEEVTIIKWLKAVGDPVNEMDALLEVNTDKVDTEIPAPASGVLLEILITEGAEAKVGDVLAVIGESGESVSSEQLPVSSKTAAQISNKPSNHPTIQPANQTGLGFISPVVARIAAENDIDLSQIKGTGLNGRITKKDVLQFMENRQSESSNTPEPILQPVPSNLPTFQPILSPTPPSAAPSPSTCSSRNRPRRMC
jgi:pyruvate/2-oxoglutarate dehydrogenase complex dihydrolipoamide acyltransferase (E2) component